MHDELVPGLLQIGRHALAHHAEADKSDAHVPLGLMAKPLCPGAARAETPSPGLSGFGISAFLARVAPYELASFIYDYEHWRVVLVELDVIRRRRPLLRRPSVLGNSLPTRSPGENASRRLSRQVTVAGLALCASRPRLHRPTWPAPIRPDAVAPLLDLLWLHPVLRMEA
jgi:hypothetical protein